MLNCANNHEDIDFDYNNVTDGIQHACLKILSEIHRVCVENDIKYTLGAGTVIGYKLFSGFIPWDDDIDLLMTRDNYQKFLEIFPAKANKNFLINHYTNSELPCHSLFAKVVDLNTTIIENPNGAYLVRGAFIDISVLDAVPSKIFHKTAIFFGNVAYAQLYKQNNMSPNSTCKKIGISILSNPLFYSKKDLIYKKYESFCKNLSEYNFSKYAELMVKNFWKSTYDANLFDEYIEIQFENVTTFLIKRYDEFLIQKYNKNDFVRNLPREKRDAQHSVFFSDTISFKDFDLDSYLKNI